MSKSKHRNHSPIDEGYFDGLDNTAKIIPATTGTRNPNVFGYTAVLCDEVDPDALQRAVEKVEIDPMQNFFCKTKI